MLDQARPFVRGPYYSSAAGKQKFLREIFDKTARHYNGIATWGWFGSGKWYRREALKRVGIERNTRMIDVASGTGAVAAAALDLVDAPEQIVCCEPSAGMIEEARKKLPVTFHQCSAEMLPVADDAFDLLTMGFALRHVSDLTESFKEFHRVLAPGGAALIMDVTLPRHGVLRWVLKAYFRDILPFLTYVFTRDRDARLLMRYYWDTMDQMTSRDDVVAFLEQAGFREVQHRVFLGCFSEYTARK